MTSEYYDNNAEDFARRTAGYDMRAEMDAFAELLPAGGSVLDAGCGPGRDMPELARRGFRVTGMDASRAMVELASARTGFTVHHLTFGRIEFADAFDGIWANASLLHVPRAEIDDVIRRLTRALRAGGAWYLSMRFGEGERTNYDARRFTDYTDESLREVISKQPELQTVRTWQTPAHNPAMDTRAWLHALLRKAPATR